ncbi:MAG: hypothetical protein ACLRVU_07105 [Beduini sp.]|uniref:hypothetical protein n=1 Tax=Beduini sp. TaxID=1922300 RepID=UPI00399F5838
MKIVKIMVLFLLEILILCDITNDVNKLWITLFLISLSLAYKNKKQSFLLVLTFAGDYFLAYQQDPILGIYFFILMQWLYFGINSYYIIGIGLLLPLPIVIKLAAIYIVMLLGNIKKHSTLKIGFLILLISDLCVGLYNIFGNILYVYLTWILYVPALLLLHQNLWWDSTAFYKKRGYLDEGKGIIQSEKIYET